MAISVTVSSNSNLLIIHMSKSKDVLGVLFNSKARVKILKFLFRNAGPSFNVKELAARIQEPPSVVKQEIKKFLEMGLLKIQKNG